VPSTAVNKRATVKIAEVNNTIVEAEEKSLDRAAPQNMRVLVQVKSMKICSSGITQDISAEFQILPFDHNSAFKSKLQ